MLSGPLLLPTGNCVLERPRTPKLACSFKRAAATVPAGGIEAVTRAFAKIIDEVNDFELEELQRR